MQIVIMAGGLATNLGELTTFVPKSMIKINGKPFLQYQIELLKNNGVTNILLCIGHLGEQIKEYFGDGEKFRVNIVYSEDGEKLLGTGGALKKAERLIEENFMLMWGDSYLLIDYKEVWSRYFEMNSVALMVVYKNNNQRVQSNVVLRDKKVILYDKKISRPDMVYVDFGLSVLSKVLLKSIPSNKEFAIEDVFREISIEGKLSALETDQQFFEIGSLAGLKEFEKLIMEKQVLRQKK